MAGSMMGPYVSTLSIERIGQLVESRDRLAAHALGIVAEAERQGRQGRARTWRNVARSHEVAAQDYREAVMERLREGATEA